MRVPGADFGRLRVLRRFRTGLWAVVGANRSGLMRPMKP